MQALIARYSRHLPEFSWATGFVSLRRARETATRNPPGRDWRPIFAPSETDLAQAQSLAAARAGFESLAAEREKTAATVAAERDGLCASTCGKAETELAPVTPHQRARSRDCANERENIAGKAGPARNRRSRRSRISSRPSPAKFSSQVENLRRRQARKNSARSWRRCRPRIGSSAKKSSRRRANRKPA